MNPARVTSKWVHPLVWVFGNVVSLTWCALFGHSGEGHVCHNCGARNWSRRAGA